MSSDKDAEIARLKAEVEKWTRLHDAALVAANDRLRRAEAAEKRVKELDAEAQEWAEAGAMHQKHFPISWNR